MAARYVRSSPTIDNVRRFFALHGNDVRPASEEAVPHRSAINRGPGEHAIATLKPNHTKLRCRPGRRP